MAMARISQLPRNLATRIKATVDITSLNSVVQGLIENSLDAGATSISIKLDYEKGSCSTEDNGHGIDPADFRESGGLGKPHHSSRLSSSETALGSHGLFLSSLAALALVSITSKQQDSDSVNALILRCPKPAARFLPAPDHLTEDFVDNGTKVSVHDLFGNIPVRVKQRPIAQEGRTIRDKLWQALRLILVGILLAHQNPVDLTVHGSDASHVLKIRHRRPRQVREESSGSHHMQLAQSILQQGLSLDISSSLVRTSARSGGITIRAFFSLKPCPSKQGQFISLGNRFMSADGTFNDLYEAVNRSFSLSSFAVVQEEPGKKSMIQGPATTDVGGTRKSIDRWPIYFIRISTAANCRLQDLRNDVLAGIQQLLVVMVSGFLKEHCFRPRYSSRMTKTVPYRKEADRNHKETRLLCTRRNMNESNLESSLSFRDCVSHDLDYLKVKIAGEIDSQDSPIPVGDAVFRSRFISSKNSAPRKTISAASATRAVPLHLTTSSSISHPKFQDTVSIKHGLEPTIVVSQPSTTEDEYFEWTNPVKKDKLRINARTGCVMKPFQVKRPATTDDSHCCVAKTRRTMAVPTRFIRSSDGIASPKNSSWVEGFLKRWHNPVFEKAEDCFAIDRVGVPQQEHAYHSAGQACCSSGNRYPTPTDAVRLSKEALKRATVISQVDSKFILIEVQESGTDMLVLVDQHASDERIKVEELLVDLCSPPNAPASEFVSPLTFKSRISTKILEQPLLYNLPYGEHEALQKAANHFADWGILYDLKLFTESFAKEGSQEYCRLAVLSLPPCIAQRCKIEPAILINILRDTAWKRTEAQQGNNMNRTLAEQDEWSNKIHDCPRGVLDLINSRACRSAIMFNDILCLGQCQSLISALAKCKFPFQCAHGRPSMIPLLDLGPVPDVLNNDLDMNGAEAFASAWKNW